MEFKISVDMKEEEKDIQAKALAAFRQSAIFSINNHFENRSRYSSEEKKVVRTIGPGTFEIDEYLAKFFGDPKTTQRMEYFINENFERIMEETMTKALQHHCNRLVFSRTRNKAKETKNTTTVETNMLLVGYIEDAYTLAKEDNSFDWSTFPETAWSFVLNKVQSKGEELREDAMKQMKEESFSLAHKLMLFRNLV